MLTIIHGDALEKLRELPAESVQCCVTSPPYWGLRDYGVAGQIGLEETPAEYVGKLVEVFGEVSRVLCEDGTLWLNLGDGYASGSYSEGESVNRHTLNGRYGSADNTAFAQRRCKVPLGLKPKDLCGIPWRVAFALQADGWYLRSDIIWHKPNPMPESVTDRPTKAHEYMFLLSKRERYYYDADAIREPNSINPNWNYGSENYRKIIKRLDDGGLLQYKKGNKGLSGFGFGGPDGSGRNRRSVWTVATAPYSEAHFATYPPDLIKPCILAGSKAGDTILDPFAGSGTTGAVAIELGRKAILIELNPEYIPLIDQRCSITQGFPF